VKFNETILNAVQCGSPARDESVVNHIGTSNPTKLETDSDLFTLGNTLNDLVNEYSNDPSVLTGVIAMKNAMKKIKNATTLARCLHLFGKDIVATKSSGRRKKIKVQPTGIARRAVGKPRNTTALPKGAPIRRRQKRPHNLADSIEQNIPNAKKHC